MNQEAPKDINIFISYSWTNPEHEEWVLNLASRLDEHIGINVTLDKWDLKTGSDVVAFMERMVNGEAQIDKVLVILDKKYVEKANKREKGVGIEAQIISGEVFKEVNQNKFLPIVRDTDEDGNPILPTFFQTRLHEDFSKDNKFEESFELLLRAITNRPYHSRPAKKVPLPEYLFNNDAPRYKTTQIANGIDSLLSTRPSQLNFKIREFLSEFDNVLSNFSIVVPEDKTYISVGEAIYNQLINYTPLRDEFLLFFDKITTTGVEFDIDLIISFFSQIHRYTHESKTTGTVHDFKFDIYRIIIYELFISLIALLLKNNNYKLIGELLYSSYSTKTYRYDDKSLTYKEFYNPIQYIDEYYKKLLNQDLALPVATLLINRISPIINENYLVEADTICYYVGELNEVDGHWYPLTNIYARRNPLNFFSQIKSKRHFEKVKVIFDVNTPDELVKKINQYIDTHPNRRIADGYRSGISFDHLIKSEKIATER